METVLNDYPVSGAFERGEDGRLLRLVREGIVRPARSGDIKGFLATPPPAVKASQSVLAALLAERRQGR